MIVNVAARVAKSAANGPGERFVLWVQGCPLACPGCWNPDTWDFSPRHRMTVDELEAEIAAVSDIEGVTFSGGEPFAQAVALAELARRVRRRDLSVLVFTGYEMDELRSPAARALLAETDVLVSGRFRLGERDLLLPLRGSRNQRIHFLTERYRESDVAAEVKMEVHLEPDGRAVLTGFPDGRPDEVVMMMLVPSFAARSRST